MSQEFTGKERDAETGLDNFLARYMSSAQGRFTSPDPVFASPERVMDPQQWNLYGYVRNNPLRFIDPTGRDCVTLDNGTKGDDGQGTPCPAAQLGTSDQVGVSAKMPKVRDLQAEAANAEAEAQAEIDRLLYGAWQQGHPQQQARPDVPLSQTARAVLSHPAIQNLPVDCGGGAFVFAGREVDLGPVTTFHGGIVEYDSVSGVSKGGLVEAGGGEGVNGGV